ncbi:MAG: rod shape-determining protein MreD [Pseudomonadota bacterium]
MSDRSLTRQWLMRCFFLSTALAILFYQLLPLDTAPRSWAGPDLILCLAFAWSVRRPELVPALSLFAIFLMADFLLQRAPGLWSLLALLACENLKLRGRSLRDASFLAEWMTVGLILIAMSFANRIIMGIALMPLPKLTLTLSELGMTLLFYPLVVAVTHGVMGVRKIAPGDLEALGQKSV